MKNSNITSLLINDLPVINTIEDFSKEVRLSMDTIYRLSKYSSTHYRTYEIPKKSGGSRQIAQPSRMLKGIQGWILVSILNKLTPHNSSTAFRKGINLLDNAMPHIGAVEIVNLDIKEFFHNTTANKIFRLFRGIGYNDQISNVLTRLTCYKGRLPQGGPCSPALANLTNLRLDRRISKFCENNSIIYTRYADDMTFSIPVLNKSKFLIRVITEIIEDEGYLINDKKTRVNGLSSKKTVTGLVLAKDSVGIGRKRYRQIRAKIYNLGQLKNPQEKDFNHILGWLSFIHSVDTFRFLLLKKYMNQLNKRTKSVNITKLITQHDDRITPTS